MLQGTGDFSLGLAAYLVEDVLARLPGNQRSFLLQTCLFESFCAAMCDAVLNRNDSADFLHKTESDNLFLLAIEADCEWYRYHPLFLAFLRSQPGLPVQDDATQLHLKAARWLAQAGRLMPAIHHASAGGQPALAAELMAFGALEMINTGQVGTLRKWVEAMPDPLLAANPELTIAGAYAMPIQHQHQHQAVPRLLDAVAPWPSLAWTASIPPRRGWPG